MSKETKQFSKELFANVKTAHIAQMIDLVLPETPKPITYEVKCEECGQSHDQAQPIPKIEVNNNRVAIGTQIELLIDKLNGVVPNDTLADVICRVPNDLDRMGENITAVPKPMVGYYGQSPTDRGGVITLLNSLDMLRPKKDVK